MSSVPGANGGAYRPDRVRVAGLDSNPHRQELLLLTMHFPARGLDIRWPGTLTKYYTMEQKKKPVAQFYYSKEEWDRLGCGPLPPERDVAKQRQDVMSRGNPPTDNNAVKGYN